MSIALITNIAAGGSVNDVTSGIADTTGAVLLVVGIANYAGINSAVPTASDSKGNAWTPRTSYANAAVDTRWTLYYCQNPTAVGAAHTFTGSLVTGYPSIFMLAFSGAALSGVYDQENGAASNGATSLATGSVTPGEDNEVLVTGIGAGSPAATFSGVTGFTISDQLAFSSGNYMGGALAYQIQTTATARNPSWTLSTSAACAASIATFRVAAAATFFGRDIAHTPQHQAMVAM